MPGLSTREASELGVCAKCKDTATGGRCIPCTRKRSTNKYVCTYCTEVGHNRRTCEALQADLARARDIDAQLVTNKATLTPCLEMNWEAAKAREDALIQALQYIAKLPKTATTWKSVAKAALEAL